MDIVLITGSGGLIGSEAVRFFTRVGMHVVGIDNDMRSYFFGKDASTAPNIERMKKECTAYTHYDVDICDKDSLEHLFKNYSTDITCVIHTAAQPSHDWAARHPAVDFTINAAGTMHMLELTRTYCPHAVFVYTSTNKVYGDTPNRLPMVEGKTRWEIDPSHAYAAKGINEDMTIDRSTHSVFGASKLAADIMVQEYGRYFRMKTVVFRGGCLTGPFHAGAKLHGFLSYLIKCVLTETEYTIYGYKGKQVRDNIHAYDLVTMFWHFFQNPRYGEVYNAGGGTYSNCSVIEAIEIAERLSNKKLIYRYDDTNRTGDHIWWISDISKFRSHYPDWEYRYGLHDIIAQILDTCDQR